jgi:hypothetical protein
MAMAIKDRDIAIEIDSLAPRPSTFDLRPSPFPPLLHFFHELN